MTSANLLEQFAVIKQAEVELTGRLAQDCISPSEPTAASNGLKLHFPTFKDRNLDNGQVKNSTNRVPDLLIKKGISESFWFEGFFRGDEAVYSKLQLEETQPWGA